MAEFPSDVVEDILVRLDVKDLIRCKSVCKSWQSFISSSRFVKAHLNHAHKSDRDNDEFGHRRIRVSFPGEESSSFYWNGTQIVGSCTGLVCVSPRDAEFVITNPSTREEKKLPTPPFMHKYKKIRYNVECWGFGYDSSADDYKVIAGWFRKNYETVFHVLTLKSNTWKVIGQVKYKIFVDLFDSYVNTSGILCGGALHWIMTHKNMKMVIISIDLTTEEFKEIPVPLDLTVTYSG